MDEKKLVLDHPVPTDSTCNSHRLSERWREPGQGALSALMTRQLEAIFQLGRALTLKHSYGLSCPLLPVTRMNGTSSKVSHSFKSDMIALRANTIISLTLGYLPWRAKVEGGQLVKNRPSFLDGESVLSGENIMLESNRD